MGCVTARELPEEEVALIKIESKLGFGKNHSFRHDAILRKYSLNGELNENQFSDACHALKIKVKSKTNTSQEAFFKKLTKRDRYRLKRVLVLSLLLGKGDVVEKAALLFEIGDTDATHTLTDIKFDRLVLKLFNIAVILIPRLAPEAPYFEHLKLSKVKVVEELRKLVFNKDTEIEKSKFIKVFDTNETLRNLLTAHGFRGFAHKMYKLNPSPWHMQPKVKPQATPTNGVTAGGPTKTDGASTGEKAVVHAETVSKSTPSPAVQSQAPKTETQPEATNTSATPAVQSGAPKTQVEPQPKAATSSSSSAVQSDAPKAQTQPQVDAKVEASGKKPEAGAVHEEAKA